MPNCLTWLSTKATKYPADILIIATVDGVHLNAASLVVAAAEYRCNENETHKESDTKKVEMETTFMNKQECARPKAK